METSILIGAMLVIAVIFGVVLWFVDAYIAKESSKKADEYLELVKKSKNLSNKIDQLQIECNLNQRLVEESNESVKSAGLTLETMRLNYRMMEDKIEEQFNSRKQELQEQMDEIVAELDRIARQKAAAIELEQKESALKKDDRFYALAITDEENSDIEVLENVRPKLNNKRILSMLIWQNFWQKKAKERFAAILGTETVCGIYKITNMLNDKCYIGQAKDTQKRWVEHLKHACDIDCPANNKLYEAMRKDGIENFAFQLLEQCPPDELNDKERYYIAAYNSVAYGYNQNAGVRKKGANG